MSQDPKEAGAQPPMPDQKLQPPGLEAEMQLQPDYGEDSYRGSGKLEGKVAIITGGDSGIGRAVALAFAREGADVLIAYLNEEPDAQETVRIVEGAGRRALAVAGDISDEAHCKQIVQGVFHLPAKILSGRGLHRLLASTPGSTPWVDFS